MTQISEVARKRFNNIPGGKQDKLGDVILAMQLLSGVGFEGFDGTVNTGYALMDNSEALNIDTNSHDTIFKTALNTTSKYVKKGTKSQLVESLDSTAIGAHLTYNVITSADIHASTRVGFWAKSNVALASGDVQFYLLDTVAGAQYVDLPAFSPGVWQWVPLDISALTLTAITRYGFKRNVAKPFRLYVDQIIRYLDTGVATLANAPIPETVKILAVVKAETGTHDFVELAEDTDFVVGSDAKKIIFMTDQSTKTCIALYAY